MRTADPGITSAMGVPSSSRRRSRARSTFPATVSSPSSGSEVKSLAHAADLPIDVTTLEVRPWGYQRQILDQPRPGAGPGPQHLRQGDRRRVSPRERRGQDLCPPAPPRRTIAILAGSWQDWSVNDSGGDTGMEWPSALQDLGALWLAESPE